MLCRSSTDPILHLMFELQVLNWPHSTTRLWSALEGDDIWEIFQFVIFEEQSQVSSLWCMEYLWESGVFLSVYMGDLGFPECIGHSICLGCFGWRWCLWGLKWLGCMGFSGVQGVWGICGWSGYVSLFLGCLKQIKNCELLLDAVHRNPVTIM